MRRCFALSAVFLMIVVLLGALSVHGHGQDTQAASKEPQAGELKGLPPRAAPTEYQSHAQAGTVTIGAEFTGHSVPTPEATYLAEDYVVVEVGMFGPPQAQIRLASGGGDFSLRINGKKTASPSQPYELAFKSLKDPEWEPTKAEQKSKTSIGTGGGNPNDVPSSPVTPKMPMDLRRTMERRVQRAAILEGDRPLPQAGLLFFEYRGKAQSIHALELIYNGAAGNITLALQP
jgi:hypothetical protein